MNEFKIKAIHTHLVHLGYKDVEVFCAKSHFYNEHITYVKFNTKFGPLYSSFFPDYNERLDNEYCSVASVVDSIKENITMLEEAMQDPSRVNRFIWNQIVTKLDFDRKESALFEPTALNLLTHQLTESYNDAHSFLHDLDNINVEDLYQKCCEVQL